MKMAEQENTDGSGETGRIVLAPKTLVRTQDLVEAVQVQKFESEEAQSVFLAALQGWLGSKHKGYRVQALTNTWRIIRNDDIRFVVIPGDWIFWDFAQNEFYKTTRQVADRFWIEIPIVLDPETKTTLDERLDRLENQLSGIDYDRFVAMEEKVTELARLARREGGNN